MRGRLQPLTAGGKNKVFKYIDWSSIATFNAPHIGGHLALESPRPTDWSSFFASGLRPRPISWQKASVCLFRCARFGGGPVRAGHF